MFKSDKYFELMETVKPSEVMLVYRNWNFSLIYPIGLVNKDFALSLTFSFAPIFFGLGILSDALLGRRLYNNVIMAVKV
jgi:hypothetical protein